MTWTNRPLWQYVVGGAVLGALALVGDVKGIRGLPVVFDVLAVAAAVLAGIAAARGGGRPLWAGAAVGVVFGAVGGLATFFVTVTAAMIRQQLHGAAIKTPMSTLVRVANSPAEHILGLVGSAVVFAVLGLVAGALAGSIVARREQQKSGV